MRLVVLPEAEERCRHRWIAAAENFSVDATSRQAIQVDVGNDDYLFQFRGGGEDRSLAVDDVGPAMGDPLALETGDVSRNEGDAVLHGTGDEHIGAPRPPGKLLVGAMACVDRHDQESGSTSR